MRTSLISCLLFLVSLSAHAQLETSAGIASYYGSRFHGKRTASGEVFDKNKMTAAHRSLPFGTIVKVIREDNGNFVYVRINDRGPFAHGRLIDLSRKAAEKLDIIQRGRQKVRLEVMEAGIFSEDLLGQEPPGKINTRIASMKARRLNLPALNILPVLTRKPTT
ncbi:MAG TPA: septal ring lytic transglycosylase RlpA family protein, partial [Anseongella sp.]|nr:septal ring lytic transglycosylase RlpA family protein [Anseongella sp.]